LAAPDPRIDPKFGAVEGDLKGRAKDLKEHPPAEEEEASRAQAPPRPPSDDKASHAKAAQAEMMARATPRGFGRAALIGVAKKAITEATPKNLDESDRLADSGKLEGMKGEVLSKIPEGKQPSDHDVVEKTNQPPHPPVAKDKLVVPPKDKPTPVQRQPLTVSRVPAPTAIVHEQRQLSPDFEQTRQLLDHLIAEEGWKATNSWAYRFINADPLGDIKYGGDLDLVGRCRQRLREEMTIREARVERITGAAGADLGDVRMAGGEFITYGNEITLELLKNSEKQLKSEIAKYGLKVDGYVFKDYSMAGGPMQDNLKAAAGRLAAQRKACDKLMREFLKAQQAAEVEGRKWGPFLGPGPDFLGPLEEARKSWVAAEDAFRAAANKEQIDFPVLAAYTTVDDAAAKLEELAAKDSAALAETLYKTIDERMQNIETVRSEIGHGFNPWTYPQIVALVKQQLGYSPWECRVVDEKAASVRSGESDGDAAKVWGVIAVGLGLLAAIPTGGSSVLAGVAAAGAAVGAAYSLNNLYEHYKEYSLASAATGTTLDKAQAISQDEPGLMWLAFDLLDLGLNVVAAAATFKTLRGAMAAARGGDVQGLKNLALAAHTSGAKPATVSRLFASVLEGMGGGQSVDQMMKAIVEALEAARPEPAKAALRDAIVAAAEELGKKQVIRYAGVNRGAAIEQLVEAISKATGRPFQGKAVREIALREAERFGSSGLSAAYVREYDFIFIRPEGELSSVLTHEMSHRAQKIEQMIENMGTLRKEFQAFHMEREVLIMLPDELAQASSTAWLRTADDAAILAHIRSEPAYAEAIAAEEAASPGINGVVDTKADAQLIVDWFLRGSAGR
jgi:hypothetical protein